MSNSFFRLRLAWGRASNRAPDGPLASVSGSFQGAPRPGWSIARALPGRVEEVEAGRAGGAASGAEFDGVHGMLDDGQGHAPRYIVRHTRV